MTNHYEYIKKGDKSKKPTFLFECTNVTIWAKELREVQSQLNILRGFNFLSTKRHFMNSLLKVAREKDNDIYCVFQVQVLQHVDNVTLANWQNFWLPNDPLTLQITQQQQQLLQQLQNPSTKPAATPAIAIRNR
ncbi:10430_t:CDS:2 [Ambispora leptoticha]|uniref:10430_t:CDS:1 n=1 Tax=Ambispora leptoticha TaxID=144679 RepID=A0A9N9A7X8_9GLOM|nr:10430_t:CDS:2 [Ambispora leptoticha]